MAYTNYNASQTLARANTYSRYTTGMCLNYCWRCTDYPTSAGLPDAKAAWYAAKYKVTNGSTPPPGAHVYWAVGTHWHIAISRGGWYVRSTDWPSKGYVGNVLISRLSSAWGARYLGWTRDYNGRIIGGLQIATSYPPTMAVDLTTRITASNLRPGKRNSDVARFEKAMWNYLGGPYRARILGQKAYVGDGFYGTLTSSMCSDSYAKAGLPRATYPGGTLLLQRLGFKNAVR